MKQWKKKGAKKKGCKEAKIDLLRAGKNGRQQMREIKDGKKEKNRR